MLLCAGRYVCGCNALPSMMQQFAWVLLAQGKTEPWGEPRNLSAQRAGGSSSYIVFGISLI